MGVAKRSISPPQDAAPAEGWDSLADAEAAASGSGDEALGDEAACSDGLGSFVARLALGRGQQDIRRYLRPARAAGAPLEDEADAMGAAAEPLDGPLAVAEAGTRAEDEAAALAMSLSLGLAEDEPDLMDAAMEPSGMPVPAEVAAAAGHADSYAEDEAAALAMGLSLGLAEDEPDLMDAAMDPSGMPVPAEVAAAAGNADSYAEDEAAALTMGFQFGLAEGVEEPPCDRGDLEEDWDDLEPCELALFEAEEAAAKSMGLPLDLEGVPAEADGARGREAATPAKRRRREPLEDGATPPRGEKRGRVAPADAPAAGAPPEAPKKGAAPWGAPAACAGRARKLQRRGSV